MKNTVGVICQKNYSGYDLHCVNGFVRRAFERMRLFASCSGDKSMLILRAVLALLCLFPCMSNAEVTTVTATGFLVKRELALASASTTVFTTMTEIGRWWNPEHTYSGDAHNLTIDLKAGGCFCERLANGGSVRHLDVAYYEPGSVLRMTGALGPLQANGLAGSLTLTVRETAPGKSVISMSYSVGGFMADGVDKMAGPVDFMLGEQLTRLKSLIETGDPMQAKPRAQPAD
jgi:uncharacterized protein YndB with AHSA1/START domain